MGRIIGEHCTIFEHVVVGAETRIGNHVLIRDDTRIGERCTVGSYVDIEGNVTIGDDVSLQSGCYITRGVVIEDKVFCGPRVTTMNDKRIIHMRPRMKPHQTPPRICHGARVGGASVLLPGVTVGRNALVGAGSVVTRNVPENAIVVGNPARVVGEVAAEERI